MKLYHGSNELIEKPDLEFCKRTNMDFGRGFYTTSSLEQASRFTEIVVRRNEGLGTRSVSIYDFEFNSALELKIKDFSNDITEWLDYVYSNRRKSEDKYSDFDLVIGPVADDAINTTFALYEDGIIDRETTLNRLKIEVFSDQFVFKSEKGLEFLKFIKGVCLDD